jgi:1-phosphofructokinase family hexose kinase
MIATLTMNPSLQYFLQVDQLPVNSVVPAKGTQTAVGGVGINVARVIKRLDPEHDVRCLGLLGGHVGDSIKQSLDAEQVSHDFVDAQAEPRIDVTVTLTTDRNQVRIRAAGPELGANLAKEVEKKLMALDPEPAYVVLGGSLPGCRVPAEIPKEWYSQLMVTVLTKKPNVKFVVDARGAELGHAVERGPFLAKPNLQELGTLAGGKVLRSEKEAVAAADDVMARFKLENLVVSMGMAGSLVIGRKARFKVVPPQVTALSSTGAGEALVGGIVVALDKGEGLEQAVRIGTAAGAARAATRTSALPTGEEVEKLLAGVQVEQL